ncbi:MAG TPA: hypothetical protein VK927_00645 [Adhaeribacter sp.]|nr:hypothetical protein [Adhaeribacter sp.]
MSNNSINLEQFAAMLKGYRKTLHDMNQLTDAEIERVNSIGITMQKGEGLSGKDAAIFINKQIYAYLKELSGLVNLVPNFKEHGCLDNEEMQLLQMKALLKLKELGSNDLPQLENIGS